MEYIYAALLLYHSKQEVTEESLKRVLSAANVNPDEARVKSLVATLSEVDIGEAIKGVGFITTPAAAPTPSEAAPKPEKEKRKEEKKEEKKEEEAALQGLGALFG